MMNIYIYIYIHTYAYTYISIHTRECTFLSHAETLKKSIRVRLASGPLFAGLATAGLMSLLFSVCCSLKSLVWHTFSETGDALSCRGFSNAVLIRVPLSLLSI